MVKLTSGVITWLIVLGFAAVVPVFYTGHGTRIWNSYMKRSWTTKPIIESATISTTTATTAATVPPVTATDSTKNTETSSPKPIALEYNVTIEPPNDAYRQFTVEESDACQAWSYKKYLFPSLDLRVEYSMDDKTGVALAKWDGILPVTVNLPHGTQCFLGRPTTESELSKQVNAEAFLCTFDISDTNNQYSNENRPPRPKKTVILDLDPERYHWHDIVETDPLGGLNIWHFHAQFFPMWLAMRIADVSINLLKDNNFQNVLQPSTLEPPVDVVMLFPQIAWERFNKDDNEKNNFEPFLVTTEKLFELHDKHRAEPSSLAGLQALNDGLEGKLIVGCHNTTTKQLFKVLRDSKMETRANAWLRPPGREGFLWSLEKLDLIDHNYGQCHNSMINDYIKPFIKSVPVKYPPRIAKHVCFISRQMREKANVPNPKVKSRNLTPDFFATLMKRIGSPIVISPHISLRKDSSDGIPVHLDRSSLTGQMRFIYYECAVVVGVHGAGLGHVFGMRPGSHMIEFQSHIEYLIFKNSALLLNNVSYTRFLMNSTLFNPSTNHELDFFAEPDRLETLITLIHDKLEDSIVRQTKLLVEQEEA